MYFLKEDPDLLPVQDRDPRGIRKESMYLRIRLTSPKNSKELTVRKNEFLKLNKPLYYIFVRLFNKLMKLLKFFYL